MKRNFTAISFAILLPTIVAIGAYCGTVITPLLLIGAIVTVTILVALNKISGWQMYLYLFGIALGLVWQTTMLGVDVVGSDIHIEYYYAQLNAQQPWDLTRLDASNTSMVIGLIAPWISKLSHLDMVWVFKVILPMFLAGVPLVLFATFKKMFGEKRAFFATMFFVAVPVFSLGIAQIAKSMVAELFFAWMIYVMVTDWRWQYKLLGIVGALMGQVMCHYTIAIMGILFLLGTFAFRLVALPIKWKFLVSRKVPTLVLLVSLILSAGMFWGYFTYVGRGTLLISVKSIGHVYVPSVVADPRLPIIVEESNEPSIAEEPNEPNVEERPKVPSIKDGMKFNPPLVQLGTGFDFKSVPIEGRIFRAIQLLTEVLILVGIGKLIYSYKQYKVPAEFIGLIASSCVLLMACIFLPRFASTINTTRFYHLALFSLSPMFVLGCETLGSIRLRR
jgi:uncharacterized membrane protein